MAELSLKDWIDPPTWKVGDTLDQETWEERVYWPTYLLLKKPIFVARRTTDYSCPGDGSDHYLSYDTIDYDDDGMATAGTGTTYYIQRTGIYLCTFNAPFYGNGYHDGTVGVRLKVNDTTKFSREALITGTGTGQAHTRCASVDIALTEGDYINISVFNYTSAAMNVKAEYYSPRLVIMWKRPLGAG